MTEFLTESAAELVVLLDSDGTAIGTANKAAVHTAYTPLHLAFSCWVVRGREILLTRRALSKITWPGVWTNSFCGHPTPGEPTADAVKRRAAFELGLSLLDVELVVPDFSYCAVDSSGIVENELCPVYVATVSTAATIDADLQPNPDEIDSFFWAPAEAIARAVEATPQVFSPWMVKELAQPQLRARLGL